MHVLGKASSSGSSVVISLLAYEAYCGELKAQLEEIKLENEGLKRKMGMGMNSEALELLNSMTSLCVHCVNSSGVLRKYSCNVVDGALKGKFSKHLGN